MQKVIIFRVTGLLGIEILLGPCFNYKAECCELWTPQPGEWCWFWNENQQIPNLRKYGKGTDYFWTSEDSPYSDFFGYKYCEPFIGELPTCLKNQ